MAVGEGAIVGACVGDDVAMVGGVGVDEGRGVGGGVAQEVKMKSVITKTLRRKNVCMAVKVSKYFVVHSERRC